jgi:glucose-6-phosphate 1-dehydrogenase
MERTFLMNPCRSNAFVFLGATGDLAFKQIFPALQAMVVHDSLDMPVIIVARAAWDLEKIKARAKESLTAHGNFDPKAYVRLCSLFVYVHGDYNDPATYAKLSNVIGGCTRPLYYLAVPPGIYAAVAEGLAKSGSLNHSRIVVEKPFGRDLASAQELNHTLHKFFPEQSIFRIDHYLGKEPVQNLLYFRFANPLVEAGWSNQHIGSVQITMAEHYGVDGRGEFYEEVGAIRDVVQNHMLEVIACLAMEYPAQRDPEGRRNRRGELIHAIRSLRPSDVIRGQFRGYRDEPGVSPDSKVETFAAIRVFIDNKRWEGVPFYVRVGKRLPVNATEVLVRFKNTAQLMMDETKPAPQTYCRFQLGPEEVIALGMRVKKPGDLVVGEPIEMVAHYSPPDEMQPYERLLNAAANGDPTLFAREDSVDDAWRIVGPVLGDATPVFEYEPNTWGPQEADLILTPQGGWHNPKPASSDI